MAASKRKLEDLSVEEFMSGDFDSDDSSSSEPASIPDVKHKKNKKKKNREKSQASKMTNLKKKEKSPGKEKNGTVSKISKENTTISGKKKQSLAEKLKEKDPEFYKFLESEDQTLLEFDEDVDTDDVDDDAEIDDSSGEEDDGKDLEKELLAQSSDDSSDDDDERDEETGGKFHKLPEKLEVASDDSEGESEDEDEGKVKGAKLNKVTTKMVKEWTLGFQKTPTVNVLREAISAFKAAVKKAGEKEGEPLKYKVVGSTVFNAVVRMCLTEVVPALEKLLRVPDLSQQQKPFSAKIAKWKKLRVDVKSYLTDLLALLSALSSSAMLDVILKHIHKLLCLYASFPKVARLLMKKMIELWSSGEETTRVLAFLCINKTVRMLQDTMLDSCMKQLYMAYVKNVKFTSPSTLPLINFMQRSLVEVFLLNTVLAYQYAFIYIRQLAIHLRNAITVKKKETCQAVYNWQFVHCLELWVALLSTSQSNDVLQPLIYPLTQTIVGTIKLLPSSRYFPLRFHCCRCLNTLSKSTDTFIPVLPFLLEVFELTDFNKKHKSVSFKPFNFACILKFSKKQQEEKVFKDGLIDQLYELLLEHFNIHAASIGFPELVLPAILQLKNFLKKCKIANYCKQIRQIVDKVEENVKFITHRRKTVTFAVSDIKAVELWERETETSGTPLSKYYNSWRKLRDRELQHEIAGKDRISLDDNKMPMIERPKGPPKATKEDKKEFSELFESDSDESIDDESRFLPRKERPAKKQKTSHGDSDDSQDYSDLDSDELEQLAQSASDDDDDDLDEESEEEPQQPVSKQKTKPTKTQKQTVKSKQASADVRDLDLDLEDDDSDLDLEDVVEDFEMSDSDDD